MNKRTERIIALIACGLFALFYAAVSLGADAPPFRIAAWQVPPEDVLKWKARNVGTFAGHVDFGGRMSKAEWERQVAERGGKFITYPGDDVKAEAQQFGRVGFIQWDEPDLSNHVDKPGYTIAEMKARYDRVKATGVPMYLTLGASDNEWYDGHPKPQKTDGSKYGHRAADGGWMAYADVCGFDFYLYTFGRTPAVGYPVIKRLLDRMNDWSGGKPIYLFIETCTQGKGTPMTADQWEDQVWHAVNYCKAKGYKLVGVFYFSHIVFPNWKAFDGTPPEIADRMTVVNAKLLQMFLGPPVPDPPPTPDVVAILKQQLADAQGEIAAKDAQIRDLNTQAAVTAAALNTSRAETLTTKTALDQSEAVRKAAQSQAATLSETLKSPQPPPTTKPSALLAQPDPRMYADGYGPLNWLHGSSVNSIRVPSDPVTFGSICPWDWSEARIKALATLCRDGGTIDKTWMAGNGMHVIYPGAPCALDYEGLHDPAADTVPAEWRKSHPGWTQANVAKVIIQQVKWFKAVAPDVKLSIIGYPYYDAAFDDSLYRQVHELEDVTSGGGYLTASDAGWVDRDLKTIRDTTTRVRSLFPAKPMNFWMASNYVAERTADWKDTDTGYTHRAPKELKPDDASSLWALGKEFTAGADDRIVIYCDLAGGYDVTKGTFGGMR